MKRFLLAAVLMAASHRVLGGAASGAASDDDVIARQQAAILLWTAGDYDRAIEATEALYRDFPDHARGKSAYFHVGNYLENKRIVEARTCAEVEEILRRALEYDQKSSDEVKNQLAGTVQRSREAAERVRAKLAIVDAIQNGQIGFRDAAERLGDMDASGAAAAYLAQSLESVPLDQRHFVYFLYLIHQTDYAESLQAAITDLYRGLKNRHPELFQKSRARYAPMVERATRDLIEMGRKAVAAYPDSPHLLDYHVYLGDAYHGAATADLLRREMAAEAGRTEAAEKFKQSALESFELYKRENRVLLDLAGRFLDPESHAMSEAQAAAHDPATLSRYRAMARDRLREIDAFLLSLDLGDDIGENGDKGDGESETNNSNGEVAPHPMGRLLNP